MGPIKKKQTNKKIIKKTILGGKRGRNCLSKKETTVSLK